MTTSKHGDSTNSLAKLLQSLTRKRKKNGRFFAHIWISCFSVCVHCLLHVTRYTETFGSLFFTLPDTIIDIDKIPENLFFSRLSSCSSQPLSSRSDSLIPSTLPYTGLTPVSPCFFRRAQHWCQHSRCISPALLGEKGSSSSTCWQQFLIQKQQEAAKPSLFVTWTHCWLMYTLLAHVHIGVHQGLQGLFCKATFQLGTSAGSYSSSATGLCIFLSFTSRDFCQSISPVCQNPCIEFHMI